MNVLKNRTVTKVIRCLSIVLSTIYLTFIVDVYTLNTTLKRLFVFGYFAIICILFAYSKKRFTRGAQTRAAMVVSTVIAGMILIVLQGVFLPTARSSMVTLQAGETGEVWLTGVEIDGELVPVSEVQIIDNCGWEYNAEYDDYVFYPNEDAVDNRLSLICTAKEAKLFFSVNAWSGTVNIFNEEEERTVADLYGENAQENGYGFLLHTPRVYSIAERVILNLGIFAILVFAISIPMPVFGKLFQKIITGSVQWKSKPISLLAIQSLLILLASIYVAFLLTSIPAVPLMGRVLIVLAFVLGGIFVVGRQRKSSGQLVLKPLLISIAIALLIVILNKDALLLYKQEFTITLHGRDGEVWLTDFSKDGKGIFVSWLNVQENVGWEYNNDYDDYVYYPNEYSGDNYLKIKVTAETAALHFASNSWSGEVDIVDSLGGQATYSLGATDDAEEIIHDMIVPLRYRSLGEQLLYGSGCVTILAFLLSIVLRKIYTPTVRFLGYVNDCIGNASSSYNQMRNDLRAKNCLIGKMNISATHLFMANTAIAFMALGCMLCERFSPDGYGFRLHFFNSDLTNFLSLGRASTFLLFRVLQKIHFNPTEQQLLSAILFLVIIAWTTAAVAMLMIRQFPKPTFMLLIIVDLSVLLSIINVFYAELFYFSEGMLTWSGGILFVLFALQLFYKVRGYKGLLFAIILLSISLGFYQAYLGFFVIWGTSIILIRVMMAGEDYFTECFIEWILLLFCGACSSFLIVLQMKFTELTGIAPPTERSPSLDFFHIWNNLRKIFIEQRRILIEGMWLFKWGIGIMLVILIICGVVALVRYKYKPKQCMLIGAMVLVNYSIVFVPHMLAQNVWLQPRTICCYFALFTFGFVLITSIHHLQSPKIPEFISVLLVLFLFSNIYKIQNIGMDQRASNILDRLECREIVNYIEKYEIANDVQIDTICVSYDANVTLGYAGIAYAYEDMNRRIEYVTWALSDSLAYYTGRQFVVNATPSEKHVELFQNGDWDMLEPEEQFVFEGNVVYIAAY